MDSVVLDGITYIKTAKAAKLAGYTADYVGQLCREKEIDCKKIGRSWYVSQDELIAHKRDAKRSSRIKARKEVHKAIEEVRVKNLGTNSAIALHTGSGKKSEIRYETDPHDLIPTPQKAEKGHQEYSHSEKTKLESGITITKIKTPVLPAKAQKQPTAAPLPAQQKRFDQSTKKAQFATAKPKAPMSAARPLSKIEVTLTSQKSEPNVFVAVCVIGIFALAALGTLEGVTQYDALREDGKTRSSVRLQGYLQEYLDHAARTVYASANSLLVR